MSPTGKDPYPYVVSVQAEPGGPERSITLAETGEYLVLFEPDGDDTGTFTLRLSADA